MSQKPFLWTFRRCPYAMRARMAIDAAGVEIEYREIKLQDKPAQMLEHSPKGTVPILVEADGTVIDESVDIMRWALARRDPDGWLGSNEQEREAIDGWLNANDDFKPHLDRYKYTTRYDDVDHATETEACRLHMVKLERALSKTGTLVDARVTLADIALFPFVRQFNNVDKNKLVEWECGHVQAWLERFTQSDRFARVMKKRSLWVGRGRSGSKNHPGN